MIDKEKVLILTELGLTLTQATVYFSLTKYKEAAAKSLVQDTTVARQDIYQILNELQELGLVERLLGKPLKFRATTVKNALALLIDRQRSKNSEIQTKVLRLFADSEQSNRPPIESGSYEPFFEIRNVYRNDPRVKTAINGAKVKIRLLDKNMRWPIFYSFIDEWSLALDRGVTIQVLIEFKENGREPKFIGGLKQANFEIRYAKVLLGGALLLFDDKELALWEDDKLGKVTGSARPKALWSNHRGLIDFAANYFQTYWGNASSLEELLK